MVRCPRCGYENSKNSTYCVNCTYVLKDPKAKKKIKLPSNSSWSRLRLYKKVAIVLAIFLLIFSAFALVYYITTPTADESMNILTTNSSSSQSTSNTPYVVKITYDGTWNAQLGKQYYVKDYSGTGDFSKRLDCVVWDHIFINVKKVDGGSSPLKVTVYQDGKVIYEKTTSDSDGSISYEING